MLATTTSTTIPLLTSKSLSFSTSVFLFLLLCFLFGDAMAATARRSKSSRRRRGPALVLPAATLSGETEAERLFECAQKIETALDARYFNGSRFAVMVKTQDGSTVYERNQNLLMQPASNLKLLTSAIALELLGPDFRHRTEFFAQGQIINGVLYGNLIVSGSTDPLVSGYFDGEMNHVVAAWADSLKALGISQIEGEVVLDNSYYTGTVATEDEPVRFSTVASFGRADAKQLAKVSRVRVIRTRKGKKRVVRRGFRRHSRRKMVSIEPNQYGINIFIEELQRRAVLRPDDVQPQAYPLSADRTNWKHVYTYYSRPLTDLLKVTNKLSDNFYADQLLRTLGGELRGEASLEKGLEIERQFLREKLDAKSAEYRLADGSGLSHENAITPALLVRLMNYMRGSIYFETYYESLSIPTVDGTLEGRIYHDLATNIRAKTGSITGITSLSGYLCSRSGKNIFFSIICNGRKHKGLVKLEDQLCKLMLEI